MASGLACITVVHRFKSSTCLTHGVGMSCSHDSLEVTGANGFGSSRDSMCNKQRAMSPDDGLKEKIGKSWARFFYS